MSGLLAALTSVAAAAAARSAMVAITRLMWSAVGALLLLIAFGFGVSAGYEELWLHYGSLYARLIMMAIFVLLALVAFVIGRIQASRRRREHSTSSAAAVAAAFALGMSRGMGRKKD